MMAQGQQMRWWQAEGTEEKMTAPVSSGFPKDMLAPLLPEMTVTPALSTETAPLEEETDTWAELEAEARRRAELGKTENEESFYLDYSVARVRYRREMRNVALVLLTSQVLSFFQHVALTPPSREHVQYELAFIEVLCYMVAFSPFILLPCYLRYRWVKNSDKPVLRLSPQGIHLRVVPGVVWPYFRSDILISWEDIVRISPKKLFASRYLEINSKKVGIVHVNQNDLPISTEELAARIADYRAARDTA